MTPLPDPDAGCRGVAMGALVTLAAVGAVAATVGIVRLVGWLL